MNIIADKDIPFLKGVLEPYCAVRYLPGADISRQDCMDADALIVRTRTRCGQALLEGTRVSFVATATIGTDHLDKAWLSSAGVEWASAPGCNACGVMQYVHTALFTAASSKGFDLRGRIFGVVGAGNTGERVARLAELLGFRVLRNDIDRSLKAPLVSLETLVRESDIVSFHLPLDSSTMGMISDGILSCMKPGAVLINTCRGEVADDTALLRHRDRLSLLILDVWNGEPAEVSAELLEAADIATPHIAGYSYEGKVNGTAMAVQAVARHFGITPLLDFRPPVPPLPVIALPRSIGGPGAQACLAGAFQSVFPILDTDRAFRSDPSAFERLRRDFPYRHEFSVPESVACPFR